MRLLLVPIKVVDIVYRQLVNILIYIIRQLVELLVIINQRPDSIPSATPLLPLSLL
jgi:hypothetical protein